MGILDNPYKINSIRPKKKPIARGFEFDKTKPITNLNAPIYDYTQWEAYGYKADAAGIKHLHRVQKTLPTGYPFYPNQILDKTLTVNKKMFGKVSGKEKDLPKDVNYLPKSL